MSDDYRFEIPEGCREFSEADFEERQLVAKKFVQAFARNVAPAMQLDESNEAWTTSVRGQFIGICPADCCVAPRDICTSKGEFLVDYIWEEKENGRRILMAGESEWGADRFGRKHWYLVEEDFEKLLAIKAPFKVLIFSSNCELEEFRGAVDGDFSIGFAKRRLELSLGNYGHNIPGETYIFIDFPQTGDKSSPGIFQSYVWLSKTFGRSEVELTAAAKGPLARP